MSDKAKKETKKETEKRLGPMERLWTKQDVMEFYGISSTTYHEMVARGEIPGKIMVGNLVRFWPEKVIAGVKKKVI